MTRQKLDEYRSKKEEIKELQYKLEHLGENNSIIGNSVINDYRTGHPRPQAVVGVDWGKMKRLQEKYTQRINTLEKECEEVEQWIEDISDSLTRRIFRMYYLDAMPQRLIGNMINLDQSAVSKRITEYLKLE